MLQLTAWMLEVIATLGRIERKIKFMSDQNTSLENAISELSGTVAQIVPLIVNLKADDDTQANNVRVLQASVDALKANGAPIADIEALQALNAQLTPLLGALSPSGTAGGTVPPLPTDPAETTTETPIDNSSAPPTPTPTAPETAPTEDAAPTTPSTDDTASAPSTPSGDQHVNTTIDDALAAIHGTADSAPSTDASDAASDGADDTPPNVVDGPLHDGTAADAFGGTTDAPEPAPAPDAPAPGIHDDEAELAALGGSSSSIPATPDFDAAPATPAAQGSLTSENGEKI